MISAENKAVFLSYASQDAEPARRICDALRAAGVEVWFDQSELVGGDAWDAKIRKQIKECALFVPVVSANTQARTEGYFRLEWRLADQRTHLMAKGRPFLLPVVIDDTRDAEAHVPESFTEVQWTRLPGGETPTGFCARVRKLLGGEVAQASSPAGSSDAGGTPALPQRVGRRVPAAAWAIAAVVTLALVAFVAWPKRDTASLSANAGAGTRPPTSGARPTSEAERLIARANAVFDTTDYTRADLAAADTHARRATELAPESAEAWAARAFVQATYVFRAWDISEKRRQDTEAFANQALAFDRNQVRAMLALAELYSAQRAFAQAEMIARKGIVLRPDDPHLHRVLAGAIERQDRAEEAARLREENARRFPRDPMTHYGLANHQIRTGDFPSAWQSLNNALAVEKVPGALLNQARLLAGWKGDLAGAQSMLDQIAPDARTEIRAVGVAMWLGLLERRLDRVQAAAALTAQPYLNDALLAANGPKAMSLALALHVAGKDTLALQQWQAAEAAARLRLSEQPGELRASAHLAIALARQGRHVEAAREIATYEATIREQNETRSLYLSDRATPAILLARYYASLGDAAKAAPYFRGAESSIERSPQALMIDPWWDKIRDQPEFQALLSEANARVGGSAASAASVVAEKSVAVLAFENKSDDPANELFSDGLSEDLIGALGRVPGLTVTGWTSSLFLKKQNLPTAEIGRQLGVAYVVRGSVYKSGNTVRITAQVSRAATDVLVWSSEPMDREVKDGFKVRDEIASLIAQALSLKLGVASVVTTASVNPEAYQLYLTARQAVNLTTREGENRAEELLSRALKLEPRLARAHAALSDVRRNQAQGARTAGAFSQRNSPAMLSILSSAQQAVSLDPNLPEAHGALGAAYWMAWKIEEAKRELGQAIALNPNYAVGHQVMARVLMTDGRIDEALAEYPRAVELDPLSSRLADNYGIALLYAGRPAEALVYLNRALVLQPENKQALDAKGAALVMLGRGAEGVALARILERDSTPIVASVQEGARAGRAAFVFALAGERAAAERALAQSPLTSRAAGALAVLGRYDDCIAALQSGSSFVANGVEFIYLFPGFDPIRQDPRFRKVLADSGALEAHDRAQAWRAAHPPEKPEAKK